MKASYAFYLTIGAVALLTGATVADVKKPPKYYCESDADCKKNFPGTVCITVDSYGIKYSKCTPNTKERPACRGAQPGMCPSYQSPESDYLNAHCVFVAKDDVDVDGGDDSPATSGGKSEADESTSGSDEEALEESSSDRRRLAGSSKDATASAKEGSSSTSSKSSTGSKSTAKSAATEKSAASEVEEKSAASESSAATDESTTEDESAEAEPIDTDKYTTVTINKKKVSGEFMCVEISDCENKAYDPSSCESKNCGSPGSKEICTHQGTCTYATKQKMSQRSCMCYKGYDGLKCEREVSGECDVDCGYGGDCVDGECVCKAGYDGKKVDGKQGKPNRRCSRCTNDLACQNDNKCELETGKCSCSPGFNGPTCGATEDSCTTKDCGEKGSCQVFGNGTSACWCTFMNPDKVLCKGTDCSDCEVDGASVYFPSGLALGVTSVVIALAQVVF